MINPYPANAATPDEALDVEAAPAPAADRLGAIVKLSREQVALLRKRERLLDELGQVVEQLKLNEELQLPAALAQAGMSGFTLAEGYEVGLEETVAAAQPKDRLSESNDWLQAHGHGGLVKREITIRFNREDEAWAKKFMADCAKRRRPLDLTVKRYVHPQTLGKFVREQLAAARAAGVDPETLAPTDLLGVFKRTVARVAGPGVPKYKKHKLEPEHE
jgi:hypothetical protein